GMGRMNRWTRLLLVLSGYALAVLASVITVANYDRRFTAADNQTMGGMIAGGEMMLGIGVFLLAAIAPTGLTLWFLPRHRPSWSMFTVAGLAFATAGLGAVVAMAIQRGAPQASWLALVDLFSLAHMLGAPLYIAAFGLFAWLAPAPDLRRRMLVAA